MGASPELPPLSPPKRRAKPSLGDGLPPVVWRRACRSPWVWRSLRSRVEVNGQLIDEFCETLGLPKTAQNTILAVMLRAFGERSLELDARVTKAEWVRALGMPLERAPLLGRLFEQLARPELPPAGWACGGASGGASASAPGAARALPFRC